MLTLLPVEASCLMVKLDILYLKEKVEIPGEQVRLLSLRSRMASFLFPLLSPAYCVLLHSARDTEVRSVDVVHVGPV